MMVVRRSQRLCSQPHSHQDGHANENERKRKRNISSAEAPESAKSKRYRLTEKNLGRHQKQEKAMARKRKIPSESSLTKPTNTTTTSTTTGPQFGLILRQNGVMFMEARTLAPPDYDEVKTALGKARELPASTYDDWQGLVRAVEQTAVNELSLEFKVTTSMLTLYKPPNIDYQWFHNDQWTEIDNEITVRLSDPKPDVTASYLLSAYPKDLREDFEELVPAQRGYAMPTFAMESKGNGDPGQAEKQAAYDGAVMTHAALAAEAQMGKAEGELYSKTKAITVTLTPADIGVYANHAVKGEPNDKITYHHYCMERIRYLASEEDWRRACTVLINAQAFAFNLASSRVRDLEEYYQKEDLRLQALKVEQEKLQTEARAKAEAVTTAPKPQNNRPKTKAKKGLPPEPVDITTVPTVNQVSSIA